MYRILAACIFALAPVGAWAADDFQAVLDKSREEGIVIVRITNPSAPETHASLEKAFNERFGLSVKLEWTPQGAPQTNARIIAEASGGAGSVDLVGLGSAEDVEA